MTDRCTQYALDVVAGVIIAGEYVRLACQRHLDDLEKAKAAPYKYYFDVEKSEEIINFAEELTIAEGDEQENVTAYQFQCFILGSLNGWRTKEKGHRRFRTSYVQLGRQNGKSFINGILACYYGNFDGYKYGKIFCTATKQDQANIVFDEIVKFINSDEDLSEWFKVHEHNHTIDCLCTHSEIKALSGDQFGAGFLGQQYGGEPLRHDRIGRKSLLRILLVGDVRGELLQAAGLLAQFPA